MYIYICIIWSSESGVGSNSIRTRKLYNSIRTRKLFNRMEINL